MKSLLKTALQSVLASRGKVIRSQAELDQALIFTRRLAEMQETKGQPVECVVFSKDRAMQLHAFLASYLEKAAHRPEMVVLFRASDDAHRASYSELQLEMKGANIRFVPETDFRGQMIDHAQASTAGKIMLFVDDMLFKEEIDFNRVVDVDTSTHILSLTRGRDLIYSNVLQKKIDPPAFRAAEGGFQEFSWMADEFSDWTFPLGVSGFMFGRLEWLAMLKSLEFRAPNSLEAAMQALVPVYIERLGLCPPVATCVCVHANMVQTELSNPTLGTFSIAELLSLWQQGKMIDRAPFYGLPLSEAEVLTYDLVDRRPVVAREST